jgi:CheY-like chemotaxis protein
MLPYKGRILCTEDDPDSREMMVFLLTEEGYDITCTENSAEAIERVKIEHFDLLLVDNWMPGLTGEELTLEIRKFNKSTPILFYSGAAYEADKQHGSRCWRSRLSGEA